MESKANDVASIVVGRPMQDDIRTIQPKVISRGPNNCWATSLLLPKVRVAGSAEVTIPFDFYGLTILWHLFETV